MAKASASTQPIMQVVDAAQRMEDFANLLYNEGPGVFQSVLRVKRFLDLADRRFHASGEWPESFFGPCTHGLDEIDCWACTYHEQLNAVLNPRGMELLEARESTLAFQTLEKGDDILVGPADVLSMCLCIFLLREHRCISRVMVDAVVIARYHSALFWKLFSFNQAHLDTVELRGLTRTKVNFKIYPLFKKATRLTKLTLVSLRLSREEVVKLCDLISLNAGLTTLVLEDTGFDAVGVRNLSYAILEHEQPKVLVLRERKTRLRGFEDVAAGLLDTKLKKLTMDLPCRLSCLFDRLGCNRTLTELEVVDASPRLHLSLHDMATALIVNTTLERLTMRLFIDESNEDIISGWQRLTRSISYNHSLKYLSFATSRFSVRENMAMAALGDAIAMNDTLVELCVDGCQLNCVSILFLLGGLTQNNTMRDLRLGDFGEDDRMSEQILLQIVELGVSDRVDCVYTLRRRGLLLELCTENRVMNIRGLRLACSEAINRDTMLACLFLFCNTLTTLYVEGAPMTDAGALCLANLFAKSEVIKNVMLLFPATVAQVAAIVGGLSCSQTVKIVTVGDGWELFGAALEAFEELLRENNSITELTILQETALGFEELKSHLQRGITPNCTIGKLRLLHGPSHKESRDFVLLHTLNKNRVVSMWARDALRESRMTGASAFALTGMSDSQAFLCDEAGVNDTTVQKKTIEALETINAQLEKVASNISLNSPKARSAETTPGTSRAPSVNSTGEAKQTGKVKKRQPGAKTRKTK